MTHDVTCLPAVGRVALLQPGFGQTAKKVSHDTRGSLEQRNRFSENAGDSSPISHFVALGCRRVRALVLGAQSIDVVLSQRSPRLNQPPHSGASLGVAPLGEDRGDVARHLLDRRRVGGLCVLPGDLLAEVSLYFRRTGQLVASCSTSRASVWKRALVGETDRFSISNSRSFSSATNTSSDAERSCSSDFILPSNPLPPVQLLPAT